jgi:hypothetical protein
MMRMTIKNYCTMEQCRLLLYSLTTIGFINVSVLLFSFLRSHQKSPTTVHTLNSSIFWQCCLEDDFGLVSERLWESGIW